MTEGDLPDTALAVIQPWAYLIVAGLKDIENRSRRTHFRGTVAIHASLTIDAECRDALQGGYHPVTLEPSDLPEGPLIFGAIIGAVDIVACIDDSRNPWFVGPFGWKLANPRTLDKPIPVIGQRGMFQWKRWRR